MKTIQVNSQPAMDDLHRPGEPKDFCRKRYKNEKREKNDFQWKRYENEKTKKKNGRPPKCQNWTIPDPFENGKKKEKHVLLH